MLLHRTTPKPGSHYSTAFMALLLLLSASTITSAQSGGGIDTAGTGGRHAIFGRLLFPSGQRADLRLKIRLESPGAGDLSVLSDMNGNFRFQALRPGNYTVVVEGGEFYETVRESVFIESANVSTRRMPGIISVSRPFNVQIYLRTKAQVSNKPGVLTAALAAIPKPAVELYLQALNSIAEGHTDKAIAELKQSLAIFPRFGLALNELGVQYMKQTQFDKASEAFRSAVSLLPDAFEPRLHYGIVLLYQSKFAESESQLREALKRNSSAITAHMYLGIALISLRNYQEAEAELQKAITLGGNRVGQAHYYLAGLYWRERNYQKAAVELEKYLELEPKAANAEKVRATIKDLRNK